MLQIQVAKRILWNKHELTSEYETELDVFIVSCKPISYSLPLIDFKCITFISMKYLFAIKMCRQKYNYKNLSSLKYRKNSF